MKKITTAQYKQQVEEILGKMKAEARPFEDDTPEAQSARIERAKEDKFFFFKTYLPHYFSSPSAPFHYELVDLLDTIGTPVAVAAPRGFAKSTITTFAYPVHQICFKLRRFIMLISDTEEQASSFAGFIKLELEENERIKQDFGELRTTGDWSDSSFVTKNGVKVLARGSGQKVRGLRNRQHRPDLVVIDDFENDQTVKNPRIVDKKLKWILEAVYPSIAGAGNKGSLFIINTLLSKKSVQALLLDNEEFITRKYQALDQAGQSLWPTMYSTEDLLKTKKTIGSLSFNKEYQNDPRDDEGYFKEEWLIYYIPTQIKSDLFTCSFCDPSIGNGESHDFKAIITVGMDIDGFILTLDAFIRKCSIDAMIEAMYVRYYEFRPIFMGLEDNLFQKLLFRDFDRAAKEKRQHLPLKGVTHTTAKESRVARLSPLVERGILRFQKDQGDQPILIEQMLYFPSTTVHDDGPDALEGAVDLCQAAGGDLDFVSTGQKCDFNYAMDRY